jgi:hypothetical protein
MMWVLWCAAVSFGRNPVPDAPNDAFVQPTGGVGRIAVGQQRGFSGQCEPGGVMKVWRTLERIEPSSRTMPTPSLLALPSIPRAIILATGRWGRLIPALPRSLDPRPI